MTTFTRILRALPLILLSPFLILGAAAVLFTTDLLFFLRGVRRHPADRPPNTRAASIVIPTWNARDLLEKYLPSVVDAVRRDAANEIIVVDNASTDGTAAYVRETFPHVRLLTLDTNHGFGGGSNAGFRAAANDVVVLLNNDMRVEPDFLRPLLDGFTNEKVFSVACQIFFSDPSKKREETGLTEGWWAQGALRVRHRIDDHVNRAFPCFYGGGGSCAYDRNKFLELGGFDSLLAPFYLEDTDLGFMAWKRGWQVLYEPRSRVYHEHRGTIGRRFTPAQIQAVLHKNFILFSWKNIHEWRKLISSLFFTITSALFSVLFGNSPERPTVNAIWMATRQLPRAATARWNARKLSTIGDTEAFNRPLGGHFRDRFAQLPQTPDPLRVLFVSPYPICPPSHGGGVFMLQTCRQLVKHAQLHLVVLLDHPHEEAAHHELVRSCASAEFMVRFGGQIRRIGSVTPHAINEFRSDDLRWLIHRKIYLDEIDVIQFEYLTMGQYASRFARLVSALFEHDIYFQSIARGLSTMDGRLWPSKALYEYITALRYELRLLPQIDMIQVCSPDNARYLSSFLPQIEGRIDDSVRAGIDVSTYDFNTGSREPGTMLFLGSFRHQPNLQALAWFTREVLPRVIVRRSQARLVVVGSEPPPRHFLPAETSAIEFRGFVEDIREPLGRYSVFICPILSGSGIRVKLLEAFASGIPVVSTRMGAEGLASDDGTICALADQPDTFAEKIIELFDNPAAAAEMARRARSKVEASHDIARLTERLVKAYRGLIQTKRGSPGSFKP